jgi:hypothetical protein
VNDEPPILAQLLELGTRFAGRRALPNSRVYADLDINGGDFIEFVEEVERPYGVDVSWVSPRDPRAEAQDPTIQALAEYVMRHRD